MQLFTGLQTKIQIEEIVVNMSFRCTKTGLYFGLYFWVGKITIKSYTVHLLSEKIIYFCHLGEPKTLKYKPFETVHILHSKEKLSSSALLIPRLSPGTQGLFFRCASASTAVRGGCCHPCPKRRPDIPQPTPVSHFVLHHHH